MNKINIKERNLEKKSHKMRDAGVIPGVLYGSSIKNTPIKATVKELRKAWEKPGEVYKIMANEKPIFVKFSEIQKDAVTQDFLHFSLLEMPKGVESEVEIPVNLKGTPVGVKKGGILLVMKDEITVNGKPHAIPEEVIANVTDMDIGDKLTVDDLNIPKRIDAVEGESEVVAVCRPPVKQVPILLKDSSIQEPERILKKPSSVVQQAI